MNRVELDRALRQLRLSGMATVLDVNFTNADNVICVPPIFRLSEWGTVT